jgi:hypothetical protein
VRGRRSSRRGKPLTPTVPSVGRSQGLHGSCGYPCGLAADPAAPAVLLAGAGLRSVTGRPPKILSPSIAQISLAQGSKKPTDVAHHPTALFPQPLLRGSRLEGRLLQEGDTGASPVPYPEPIRLQSRRPLDRKQLQPFFLDVSALGAIPEVLGP